MVQRGLTILAAALIVAVLPVAIACSSGSDDTPDPAPTRATGSAPVSIRDEEGLSTVEIVEKLAPSIVRVQTEGASLDSLGRSVPGGGVGTGVIIDADGHIVTNNHVIAIGEGVASRITVTLADERTMRASVVGRDAATDLAVLDINASDLTAASFGDAGALEVGQDVVAIGFALDLEGGPTVTRGVISAKGRIIEENNFQIPDAIQTDAGINPGNSGGPLVNARGEIVGINTAIIRGAQSIGFSISASLAQPIVETLIADGRIERGYLGVGTVPVTDAIAQSFGLPVDNGLAVTFVATGTPAEEAGLQKDDVITAIDGEEVRNNGELLAILARRRAGDTVAVEYYRGNDRRSVDVTLAQRPDQ